MMQGGRKDAEGRMLKEGCEGRKEGRNELKEG